MTGPLLVADNLGGGAGIAVTRLAQGLQQCGASPSILVRDRNTDIADAVIWGQHLPPLERRWNKVVHAVTEPLAQLWWHRQLHGRPDGFENFSVLGRGLPLANHPRFVDADIIHFHWASSMFPWQDVRNLDGKRVYITLHDLNWLTGGCHYNSGCRGFEGECAHCPQLAGSFAKNLARQQWATKSRAIATAKNLVRALISPSHWLAEEARRSSLWRGVPVFVVRNAHDTNLFRPFDRRAARELLNLPQDRPIALLVGHSLSNRRKGFDLVAPDRYRDDVYWVSAGRSPQQKSERIHHLGLVRDEPLMVAVLSAADVVVVPSREENYSNLILEARLCGTPVVAFDVGGNAEAVAAGGILVPEVNAEALAEAVRSALRRPWERNGLHRHAAAETEASLIGRQHLEVYAN